MIDYDIHIEAPAATVFAMLTDAVLVNLFTFEAGPAKIPMADAFEVRGDRISRIDLFFDPSPFAPPGAKE